MTIPLSAPLAADAAWPALPADSWGQTLATFHRWTQVVGKIRMGQGPWHNHSWGVPLYVTAAGFGTSLVPYGHGGFEIDFDLLRHRLEIRTTAGTSAGLQLHDGLSVAAFYALVMDRMRELEMPVSIDPIPSEIPHAVPFDEDRHHASYVPDHAEALWRAMLGAHRVFGRFRAGYIGKASPVHLFWGSLDLAASRFSGRTAPPHPGGLPNFPLDVAREAYSHEVTSVGFWPGNEQAPEPIFYAYAYPSPAGYAEASVQPEAAYWLDELGEFVLPYDAVRRADDPDATLLAFLESTHAAAADLAGWDREALELDHPAPHDWWRLRSSG